MTLEETDLAYAPPPGYTDGRMTTRAYKGQTRMGVS